MRFALPMLGLSLAGALLINGSLFWALWSLVSVDFEIRSLETTRIEFTRMKRDTETASKREEKIEKERPPVVPETPRLSINSGAVDANVVALAPFIDTTGAMSGINLGAGSDRDVMPLVRINPDYPQRALSRGIEGWVLIRFTISANGSVQDATVVDSEPPGIFDQAALRAIARWRYNPRVENAVAVERVGVQTIIRFNLEQ